jgi:hypothetical protein
MNLIAIVQNKGKNEITTKSDNLKALFSMKIISFMEVFLLSGLRNSEHPSKFAYLIICSLLLNFR